MIYVPPQQFAISRRIRSWMQAEKSAERWCALDRQRRLLPPSLLEPVEFHHRSLHSREQFVVSDPLKYRREAHAGADAHRDHAMLDLRIALHGADERSDAYGSSGTEGMAQRYRAALRIYLRRVEVEDP